MPFRPRVFVSYDPVLDYPYRQLFGEMTSSYVLDRPDGYGIEPGMSDEAIRERVLTESLEEADVLVVLIGSDTWRRRVIDWEIAACCCQEARGIGVLGVLLPSYAYAPDGTWRAATLPRRLNALTRHELATIHPWPRTTFELDSWIEQTPRRRPVQAALADPLLRQDTVAA